MDFLTFLENEGYPRELFNEVLNNKNTYTYNFKAKGKWQIAPKWEYKIIQKILKSYLSTNYSKEFISNNATAYIKNKNISYNVERHQGNNYFYTTDFKNFFPSVKKDIVSKLLKSLDDELLNHILNISFFNDRLQYGFPTSPIISNFIMKSFDDKLQNILEKAFPNQNIQYTRYSDDITISSKYKINKIDIQNQIVNLISEPSYNFLKINKSKTRYFEKYSKKPYITGLVPLNKRNTIGKKKINQTKLNIYLLIHNIDIENDTLYPDITSLKSYLAYMFLVDPHNYNRLKNYFFKRYTEDYILNTLFKK